MGSSRAGLDPLVGTLSARRCCLDTNGAERRGTPAPRGTESSGAEGVAVARSGGAAASELRAGQALAQAIPGGGRDGPAAWQHGETVEPGEAGGVAGAGPGAGAGEVWRGRGGWIRADAGGRAPGERPRDPDRCDHTTEVDADGGALEAAAQAQAAETPTGAEGAFRGAAAAGREPSQVAGRARAEGVSDEPGGRRDRGAQCLFAEEETTWAAADLLERWVRFYGVPQALYTDWSTVYLRKATERERLEGVEPATQFGTMCEKLGIEIIGAGSAQAKGRVERANGTHQDRLIKKLRLRGINGYGEANLYLANEYLPEHNERFQREPASEVDYHRSVREGLDLRQVFCLEQERVTGSDMVVRFENRFLQLQVKRNQPVWPGTRVTVRQWRDGSLAVHHDGIRLRHKELEQRPAKPPQAAGPGRRAVRPSSRHPWRRYPVVVPKE